MFLGYNTNGFAHHRLEDVIAIIAELGYGGVALTPDVHHLNPQDQALDRELAFVREVLARHKLRCVIETGSRFLLDKWRKHQPTLLTTNATERMPRIFFLLQAIDIAAKLDADCLSFWSGTSITDEPASTLFERLVPECRWLAEQAASKNVRLAFEPEPGMFIDTMDKFAELHAKVNHPAFGLTIDIGHLVCNGELPVSKFLADWKHVLWNVHIEDMKAGVHDHLMFGEGDVDFADVFTGLRDAGYDGGVYVELSRHSHDAVNTARKSKTFLQKFLGDAVDQPETV